MTAKHDQSTGQASGAHDHAHDHDRVHDHPAAGESKLLIALALTLLTLIAQGLGGWISGSLALLTDAAHMLIDACALLLAWAGAHFGKRPADAMRSFGYARLEVLAGYSNALLQILLVIWIFFEAVTRLLSPAPVLSGVMLGVALGGLAINALVLGVLGAHTHDDLNVAGARLHVIGDLLGSIGAVVAALIIRYAGWLPSDALVSMLVAALMLIGAWRLLRRSAHILLEGTPQGVDADAIATALIDETAIAGIHHVHVWQLAGGRRIATLQANVLEGSDANACIARIRRVLREGFHITHATVQLESRGCVDADADCTATASNAQVHHDHSGGGALPVAMPPAAASPIRT